MSYLYQEDGQAMVEYALIFALLVLLIFAVLKFGVAAAIQSIYGKIIKNVTAVVSAI